MRRGGPRTWPARANLASVAGGGGRRHPDRVRVGQDESASDHWDQTLGGLREQTISCLRSWRRRPAPPRPSHGPLGPDRVRPGQAGLGLVQSHRFLERPLHLRRSIRTDRSAAAPCRHMDPLLCPVTVKCPPCRSLQSDGGAFSPRSVLPPFAGQGTEGVELSAAAGFAGCRSENGSLRRRRRPALMRSGALSRARWAGEHVL